MSGLRVWPRPSRRAQTGAAHRPPCPGSAPRGRRVFLAVFAAALGPLSFGFALGYSSPAIPSLRRAAPPAPRLDNNAASWFGVRPLVGTLLLPPLRRARGTSKSTLPDVRWDPFPALLEAGTETLRRVRPLPGVAFSQPTSHGPPSAAL